MQSSHANLRPEDAAGYRRRGHAPQISISDDNHHVTEAIGDMYGDNDWDNDARRSYISIHGRDGPIRPLSFLPGADMPSVESPLTRSLSTDRHTPANAINGTGRSPRTSMGSINTPNGSPDLSRSPSADTASQQFPLNDIDYESSPAAVAQELSNLQAIRRMSMNVDAADPDLPHFGSHMGVPSMAPSNATGDDDTARLFWVPARLHPELAPKEFKTFVEDRVDQIQRRSRDADSLSPESSSRSNSINRRKSMLSKTFESASEYRDGADVLERKRSSRDGSFTTPSSSSRETSLQELESLVNDPASLVRKMSIDSARVSTEGEEDPDADLPILPQPLGLQPLKRSTRTNYRRGSLRKGERVPHSRRAAARQSGSVDNTDSDPASPPGSRSNEGTVQPANDVLGSLQPAQEPLSTSAATPSASAQQMRSSSSIEDIQEVPEGAFRPQDYEDRDDDNDDDDNDRTHAPPQPFQSRFASNGRTTAAVPTSYNTGLREHDAAQLHQSEQRHQSIPSASGTPTPMTRPERSSSHGYGRQTPLVSSAGNRQVGSGASGRRKQTQTLDDMANNPSMMPGNSMSTDALSFIPTFEEERSRPSEKERKRDRKDSGDSSSFTSKKGWGWLRGSDDKDSKKEKEEPALTKKAKARLARIGDRSDKSDKSQDRLDILSQASETHEPRGRESLVLDRATIRLEEERKKDNVTRKSAEPKKEGGNIFSNLFGGKKKGERESASKKTMSRVLTPEPVFKILRPDIDYNWTRFSILEERAIYRMAHIKLANPRRALYSQVLLSNFMYSYLAKVQQMHPQIQIPQFIQQKNQRKQDQEQQQQQQSQPEEFSTWQRYQEQQQHDDNDGANGSDARRGEYDNRPGYVDDYDPVHQQHEDERAAARAAEGHYEDEQSSWDQRNHYIQRGYGERDAHDDGDMW